MSNQYFKNVKLKLLKIQANVTYVTKNSIFHYTIKPYTLYTRFLTRF